MLEVNAVGKKYRDFVLRDISFSLEGGYLTGMVGANGAGKTTLLRILAGIDSHFKGDFSVNGISFRKSPLEVKNKAAYIAEGNSFFWEKTALENAELLGNYYSRWSDEIYGEWLERLQISAKQPLGELSKGGRMKFQIAFAMAHQPCVFLLDEPTAGFDPVFRKEFRNILQELLEDKISVLMSTHIISDLEKIADEIILLENGELVLKENRLELEDSTGRFNLELGGAGHIRGIIRERGERNEI